MKPIAPIGFPIGFSFLFWFFIGFLRYVSEKIGLSPDYPRMKAKTMTPADIAVIVPAHNEELVIRANLRALKESLSPRQIYLASDGSTDSTAKIARKEGVHVSEINPGRGKAKAMIYLLERYKLLDRYKLIFIVDADTRIDKTFVERGLPFFDDPQIGVISGSARIHWPRHIIPKDKLFFVAYRERLNRTLTFFMIYGQTWKYASMNYVIPGFATIYRSNVLRQLEIDTPGLLIEDFNLAFQFHRKKLGKLGYHPSLIGWDQHPNNVRDYWKQVRRWNIGFFQTVRKNGVWPSFFWFFLGLFSIEVFVHSLFILALPFLILFLVIPDTGAFPLLTQYKSLYADNGPFQHITLATILINVFLIDYLMTVLVGLLTRKPQFMFYGIYFFFIHYITALILISSVIPGFFSNSEGKWISPTRRAES